MHHPNGLVELQFQIGTKLDLPYDLNTEDGFKEFLFLTQVIY